MPLSLGAAAGLGGTASLAWAAFLALYYRRRKYWKETGEIVRGAPQLPEGVKISVVVPAYNEEGNIADCARAILDCSDLGPDRLELLVCDDMSKDGTVREIEGLKKSHPRGAQLTILSAGPRPADEVWLGKCWAVWQASKRATGDWIVFVDADVRLKRGGLERAVAVAAKEDCDLLSGDVAFACSCSAERLVQPLIIQNLVLNNDHRKANAPADQSDLASAAGHIMIFKKASYDAFGGHGNENIRDHVVEDVMLATFVKNGCGGTVHFYDFTSVAEIQMYDDWGQLIEGYSKNIYLAHGESALSVLLVSALNILAFAVPALLFAAGVCELAGGAPPAPARLAALLALPSFCFAAQFAVRRQLAADGRVTSAWWWAQPVGSLALVSIALLSLFKGFTGIGWTWKGRPLRMPEVAARQAAKQAEESKKDQ